MVPQALDKINRLRKYMDDCGYSHVRLEVDGNCSMEWLPKMKNAGADIFVLGSSSLFLPGTPLQIAAEQVRSIISK